MDGKMKIAANLKIGTCWIHTQKYYLIQKLCEKWVPHLSIKANNE